MIILDQDKIEGDFAFIGELHREMIRDIIFEVADEISPLGLVVLQSAGTDDTVEKWGKMLNISLEGYDYLIGDKKYKLENITFY